MTLATATPVDGVVPALNREWTLRSLVLSAAVLVLVIDGTIIIPFG